jgi:hypothetical protein
MNEAKQFRVEGISYLFSIWNYIDLIPPIGIYALETLIIIGLFDISIDASVERTFLSVITFFMWFKVLYFMRIYEPKILNFQ